MRTLFKYGGIVASIMLIVAGAVSIGAGTLGVMQVRNALSVEKIVGSLKTKDGAMRELIYGVVESAPFQKRRGDGDRVAASK